MADFLFGLCEFKKTASNPGKYVVFFDKPVAPHDLFCQNTESERVSTGKQGEQAFANFGRHAGLNELHDVYTTRFVDYIY